MCSGPVGIARRRVLHCPTCDSRRRFVERWGGAWYGPTLTCCACGDAWTCGERHPRPFKPRWRQERTAAAARDWTLALSGPAYRAAVKADTEAALVPFE